MKVPLEPYVPPPIVSQSIILTAGFILFLLAYLWPPLVLLVSYVVSLVIPYCFRLSDDSSVRRRAYHTFIHTADLPPSLRQVPDDIILEEGYWQNSRYVKSNLVNELQMLRKHLLTQSTEAWPCMQLP